MRTGLFLMSGFLLLAASLVLGKLFSSNFPNAPTIAAAGFVALWLLVTGFNMWVGVTKAGYSVTDELPIFVLLFAIPAAAAILARWKLL